jgi:topoisomerase-4 subunit A
MKDMGMLSSTPAKKSARIVGDVIGKYHPHGDSSVYEAMARMAQSWNLRYPLVDGQGNFGSLDGDSPAAMRYTEARLTKFSEAVLLPELNMGTIDWADNYDNTMKEPASFPAKLNMMLLNGAMGIAVGMASDVPSHNIKEVTEATIALMDNENLTVDEIMDILKGPDFPGGAQIIDSLDAIKSVYEKGQGTIRVRARWHVEKLSRGQWQIIVDELPPQTSTLKVLENIAKITSPTQKKDKNGKPVSLSKKVQQEKLFVLSILESATDESDKNAPIRLVLEPKSSRQDPDEMMAALMTRLELEKSIKVNLTTVGLDGLPKQKNILQIMKEWNDYRFDVVTRRTEWRLGKVQDRLHILEGRLIALMNIDKVIKIIKDAEEPKDELISQFNITEIQAEDILEIRLRQLAKMESIKLEKEQESLIKEEKTLQGLLTSKTKMKNLIKKEIQEVTQVFTDERRTLIKEEEALSSGGISESVVDEDVTIIYTEKGWFTLRKGHGVELDKLQLKTDDDIKVVLETRMAKSIGLVASNGRAYSIKPVELPSGKGGFAHINTLLDLKSANIVSMVPVEDKRYLIANNSGYAFIFNANNLETKNKAGKNFMNLPADNTIIYPLIPVNENDWINIVSQDNRLLCFVMSDLFEFKELDKGKGYQLMRIPKGNFIKQMLVTDKENVILQDGRKKIKLAEHEDTYLSKRAHRGKKIGEHAMIVVKD